MKDGRTRLAVKHEIDPYGSLVPDPVFTLRQSIDHDVKP